MIVYSVTISVDREVEEAWVKWMQETHVPEVMQTGYFMGYRIHRIIDPEPEAGRSAYTVDYACDSLESLAEYQKNAGPALRADHSRRFGERFTASRRVLETLATEGSVT